MIFLTSQSSSAHKHDVISPTWKLPSSHSPLHTTSPLHCRTLKSYAYISAFQYIPVRSPPIIPLTSPLHVSHRPLFHWNCSSSITIITKFSRLSFLGTFCHIWLNWLLFAFLWSGCHSSGFSQVLFPYPNSSLYTENSGFRPGNSLLYLNSPRDWNIFPSLNKQSPNYLQSHLLPKAQNLKLDGCGIHL